MAYVEGQTIHDADSHVMELPAEIVRFVDPAWREAFKDKAAKKIAEPDLVPKARALAESDGFRAGHEANLLLRKNYQAHGAFKADDLPRTLDLLGFASQLVFTTSYLGALLRFDRGEDVDLSYALATGHNRGMVDFCSVDRRLLPVCYVPFTDIGAAVMKMLADTRGIRISEADEQELKERFSTMPPHPEVPAALRKLRDAGFRLFALTDNLLEVQTRQLEHGGIVDLFERRFSADAVKRHKPSREAYAYVERELGVAPSQLCLIACHTWDTLGAVAAGWQAALIRRVGNDVLGVGPQPGIVGNDLNDVADQLIARHRH